MDIDFDAALAECGPSLLRHCYRMLGSLAEAEDLVQSTLERAWKARASYRGDAPVKRWLFTIATNACLNVLSRRRRLVLPQLESEPSTGDFVATESDESHFVTPAADRRLFPDPSEIAEAHETIALAFVALLQRVPPKQRAALLMKDVLGWSAEEIAEAVGLSVSSVNSALHRGREAIAHRETRAEEPSPETLRDFVRAWETRDLDGLVTLLRDDIVLGMPPHAIWFRGLDAVMRFFRSPRFSAFWSGGIRLSPTRANGLPAFGFHRIVDDGMLRRHSIMIARFVGGQVAEMTVFVGTSYFAGFDLRLTPDRTV